jgi:hypothetical protein
MDDISSIAYLYPTRNSGTYCDLFLSKEYDYGIEKATNQFITFM